MTAVVTAAPPMAARTRALLDGGSGPPVELSGIPPLLRDHERNVSVNRTHTNRHADPPFSLFAGIVAG